MPSDDILELLGRYATGPLTEEERHRLFDAALNDQNLFEELAREQELKMLLQQPGARDRMIRVLNMPNRRAAWILTGAIAAALSVVLIAFVFRPKPQQVVIAKLPQAFAAPEAAPAPPPRQPKVEQRVQSQPAAGKPVPAKQDVREDQPVDLAVPIAPAPAPAPQSAIPLRAPQNAVGSPRQPVQQAAAAAQEQKIPAFGFHYSLDTKGHVVIVPAADGYLFVKASDGKVLFERKQIASAITTDIVLPGGLDSIVITFSDNEEPVEQTPAVRNDQSGNVEGSRNLAVQIKVPRS